MVFTWVSGFARALVCLAVFAASGAGATDWIDLSDKSRVGFEIPTGWKSVKDLFGMPLTLIGPRHDDASSVIVFSPSGIKGLKFDEKSLKENESQYREGREKWLSTRAGRSIRYFGYQKEKWDSGLEVHHVGYEYALLYIGFSEDSYFVLCNDELYHLKTLVRTAWGGEAKREIEKIAKSFRCSQPGGRK